MIQTHLLNWNVNNLWPQQYIHLIFTVENYWRWRESIKATPLSLYSTPFPLFPVSAFAPSGHIDPILPSFPSQNSKVGSQADTLSHVTVLNKVNLISVWWLKTRSSSCFYVLWFLLQLWSHTLTQTKNHKPKNKQAKSNQRWVLTPRTKPRDVPRESGSI